MFTVNFPCSFWDRDKPWKEASHLADSRLFNFFPPNMENDGSRVTPDSQITESGKKKEKLNGKQFKKLQVKQQEEARIQTIFAKQKYLEQTKERVQAEWEVNKAKSKVYMEEQERRIRDFRCSYERLWKLEEKWAQFKAERRKEAEWKRYMRCERLPDPTILPQMNTYRFIWTEVENDAGMAYTLRKATEVMQFIAGLDEAISDPSPGCPDTLLNAWKSLRNEMRDLLQTQIDKATYRLFRRIETDMVPIDVTTSEYFCEGKHFSIHLWAELITPIPSLKASEVRQPLKVSFLPASLTVAIPVSLLDVHKVIRVMLMGYDHWTDRCRSFNPPAMPPYHEKDLLQLAEDEVEARAEIVRYRENLEAMMKKKISNIPAQPTLSQELFAWDTEPQRVLSEEITFREGELEELWVNEARTKLREYEVNVRERDFLGGVLGVEIFHQPPQPKYLRYKHDVTLLTEAPLLHSVQFVVKYPPTKPEMSGVEEASEESRRAEEEYQRLLKQAGKTLISVSLALPNTVYWFETPEVALWNEEGKFWSSEHIHDRNFDEESQVLTFKMGSLGLIGLHVSRFCNLPYKEWKVESDGEGGVNFYLKAAKIAMKFKIQNDEVCLENLEDFPGRPATGMLNTFHTPVRLVQMMKSFGIDVFPESDAACYGDLRPKHVVCERYVYQMWALFSSSFVFENSKFNRERDRRTVVFQMREVYDSFDSNYCLIRTSPVDACILDITEESSVYSPEPAPGIEVCTDLYNLIMRNCTTRAKRTAETTDFVLVETLRDFLGFVRPLSFS